MLYVPPLKVDADPDKPIPEDIQYSRIKCPDCNGLGYRKD